MWPFKKKREQEEQEEQEETPPVAIGERFRYLGVEMVCSRHRIYPYTFTVVVADYVTNTGNIEQAVFCPVDWISLVAELTRK